MHSGPGRQNQRTRNRGNHADQVKLNDPGGEVEGAIRAEGTQGKNIRVHYAIKQRMGHPAGGATDYSRP